ncbi:MAG: UbiX family flavin prenyltransferase [Armatimonadota bacterium]
MRLYVAITGASGAIYAVRLLARLLRADVEVLLSISPMGCRLLKRELDIEVNLRDFDGEALLEAASSLTYHHFQDLAAPPASGSAPLDGMVVVPCSMGRLARIAAGTATDLIDRAADVCLKEGRKLVLVPRETPLSLIHLRNMQRLAEAGATILPASPAFYHRPEGIEALVDTVIERIMAHLGVADEDAKRWTG